MRDVVKTNVKRDQNRKRKSRRRRHTPLYFFMVILIVTGLGILLSVTLFFNVKNVNVKGDVDYTTDDIIRMSGIRVGDNLIRLDSERASQGILSSMIYIEKADIEKQYPGTVVINVSRCIPTANVECSGGYLIVSEKGKILDKSEKKYDDLVVIKGFEPSADTLGTYLSSVNKDRDEIVLEFLKKIAGDKKSKMSTVDLTDVYEIMVNYDERIDFKMGNSNDISYKLSLAETVLKKIGSKKRGTMTMARANQISFRENQSVDNESNTKKEKPEPTEEKPTDATEAAEQNNDWDNGNNYNNNGYGDEADNDEYGNDDGYNYDSYDNDNYNNYDENYYDGEEGDY